VHRDPYYLAFQHGDLIYPACHAKMLRIQPDFAFEDATLGYSKERAIVSWMRSLQLDDGGDPMIFIESPFLWSDIFIEELVELSSFPKYWEKVGIAAL
jgi:hypothetical protein